LQLSRELQRLLSASLILQTGTGLENAELLELLERLVQLWINGQDRLDRLEQGLQIRKALRPFARPTEMSPRSHLLFLAELPTEYQYQLVLPALAGLLLVQFL
jgi:hypothetical protein